MVSCPFYGCTWPDNSSVLVVIGGDQCGLEVDHHDRCAMEQLGDFPDYFRCPVVALMRPLLDAGRSQIGFGPPGARTTTLAEWENTAK